MGDLMWRLGVLGRPKSPISERQNGAQAVVSWSVGSSLSPGLPGRHRTGPAMQAVGIQCLQAPLTAWLCARCVIIYTSENV